MLKFILPPVGNSWCTEIFEFSRKQLVHATFGIVERKYRWTQSYNWNVTVVHYFITTTITKQTKHRIYLWQNTKTQTISNCTPAAFDWREL